MRTSAFLPALLIAASASAQSTYETPNEGTLNLVAGLTTITDYSAANSSATAANLALMTDSNWASTGITNIGFGELATGTFAGNFGGATYHSANYSIIIIGARALPPPGYEQPSLWGEWDVQLLLANGTYTNAIRFTSSDTVANEIARTGSPQAYYSYYYADSNTVGSGSVTGPGGPTSYLRLTISDFDLADIGVTGIKLSGFTGFGPDLNYIGVVEGGTPVPEPSTYGLALGGLALAVVAARRRAKK